MSGDAENSLKDTNLSQKICNQGVLMLVMASLNYILSLFKKVRRWNNNKN